MITSFIQVLARRGTIKPQHALAYEAQVDQLITQVAVDSYLAHAVQSQKTQKTRLALHYSGLALKLMTRKNTTNAYTAQIAKVSENIAALEKQLALEDPQSANAKNSSTQDAVADEWAKLDQEEKGWKKKRIYD